MSFEEKNTWVYAAISLVAYGAYLAIILGRAQGVALAEVPYAGTMLWTIGAAIAASIVGRIVVAVAWPRDAGKKDERDREIYRFGEYIGQSFVVAGAAAALRHGHGRGRLLLDRQRDLPGVRAVGDARRRGQAGRLPPGLPAVVKPTRVINTIRALRFAHGEMTQAELADRIGVTRQTVIAIEQGRYSPSLEMAFRIARVFGVPLDDVFQYPDTEA